MPQLSSVDSVQPPPVVEAVSPHGWDNATMQLAPSLLALLWLAECVA